MDAISPAILTITALSFARDDEPVLTDFCFALHEQELVLVRGLNGTGKTTLLKLLGGLLPWDHGVLTWRGTQIRPTAPDYLRNIGFLGHQLGLKEELTCAENLSFYADLAGTQPALRDLLRAVGLAGYASSLASDLSAGQRKRLAMARLVLSQKPLWFLDEPYSNLDKNGIALMDRLICEQITRGGSVLASSHGTFTPELTFREVVLQ